MSKLIILISLLLTSCEAGHTIINKISGHEESCDKDGNMVYHEERQDYHAQ